MSGTYLRRAALVAAGLLPALATRSAEAQRLEVPEADVAQSAVLTPAPISRLSLSAGATTIQATAGAGHFSPRAETSRETTALLGGIITASHALTDRWFLTGALLYAQGAAERLEVNSFTGSLGGGLVVLGGPEDWASLCAAANLLGSTSRTQLGSLGDVRVSGLAVSGTLEAELRPIPWVSVVPYFTVHQMLGVAVGVNGEPLAQHDLAMTTGTSGLDVWVYLNPEDRGSHISVSSVLSLFQETRVTLITAGYGIEL